MKTKTFSSANTWWARRKENYFPQMRQKSTSHVICVDLMVQNNENKRIIPKNDGTFKLSSQFRRNLIDFAGGGGEGSASERTLLPSFLINEIVVGNSPRSRLREVNFSHRIIKRFCQIPPERFSRESKAFTKAPRLKLLAEWVHLLVHLEFFKLLSLLLGVLCKL